MASFFQDLWESIFTPGPTPTLLVATNVTFAALQLVLAILLFATWSIHFTVLSVLCGGLWWSINWFARELKLQQEQEEEKARRAREAGPAVTSATSDESETEVEGSAPSSKPRAGAGRRARVGGTKTQTSVSRDIDLSDSLGSELKQRGATLVPGPVSPGLRSGVSTEDEWEKVSENEREKDK
jgi:hypothetical protein